MTLIRVTERIAIDEAEIDESFIRASGPGGQNVNKVATAVQLRFDVAHSDSLPAEVRQRLLASGDRRLTQDGILVLTARRFRTQERNREDARARLLSLISAAARPAVRRKATRPTLASQRRRLESKASRAGIKRDRSRPRDE